MGKAAEEKNAYFHRCWMSLQLPKVSALVGYVDRAALVPANASACPDPMAERLVRLAYGEGGSGARMSRERFAEVLNAYSDQAMEEAGQSSMFGGNLGAADLLQGAVARVARGTDEVTTASAYPAPGGAAVGRGDGGGGEAPRGSPDDARRQGAAIGNAGERSVVEAAPLTSNFDGAAAERYATARGATRDRYATFRNTPGVGAMLKEGRFSGEFAPSAALPL